MIEFHNWIRYDKAWSTNQLFDRNKPDVKKSKMGMIRLDNSIFRVRFDQGHSNVMDFDDGTLGQYLELYQLYDINFVRLLKENYKNKFKQVWHPEDLKELDTKGLLFLYSSYYQKDIHEFTKKNKLYYITLTNESNQNFQ